jgi:hypothetical protein
MLSCAAMFDSLSEYALRTRSALELPDERGVVVVEVARQDVAARVVVEMIT